MPLPLLAAAGVLGAGKLAGSVSDWLGGDDAAKAQKAAQAKARGDITTGFDEAKGYQKPVYDRALGQYGSLSDKYNAGEFSNPKMSAYDGGKFSYDPNEVFNDPEYKAQMRAGTDAINGGAASKNLLFSGTNARDLTKFGQDTFAGRSDALRDRDYQQFTGDRDFGFNANNTAFNQNAQSNSTAFNEGLGLTSPLAGATAGLTGLATGEGNALANNDIGSGEIRAGNINNTAGAIGGLAGDLADIGGRTGLGKLSSLYDPKTLGAGVKR